MDRSSYLFWLNFLEDTPPGMNSHVKQMPRTLKNSDSDNTYNLDFKANSLKMISPFFKVNFVNGGNKHPFG